MKQFLTRLRLALLLLSSLAVSASAQESAPEGGPGHPMHGPGLHVLEDCLSTLGLSSEVQAATSAILASAKPTLQADANTLMADHQKLRTDIANNADQSVLGQDLKTQIADRTKMDADRQAVRSQVLSKLSETQQNALNECLRSSYTSKGRWSSKGPHS